MGTQPFVIGMQKIELGVNQYAPVDHATNRAAQSIELLVREIPWAQDNGAALPFRDESGSAPSSRILHLRFDGDDFVHRERLLKRAPSRFESCMPSQANLFRNSPRVVYSAPQPNFIRTSSRTRRL
jgi:hypothetical protein